MEIKKFKIRASACGQIMGLKGLGKTGQTYCETWLKEQIYNRKKEFSNKYIQKGMIMEDNSLDFIADYLGYGMLLKNEDFYNSEYIQGTPDIVLKDEIIDVKNSWDCFTFPFFETEIPNKDYYWQAQCYMEICKKDKFKLIYVLSDTPEHLIASEVRKYVYANGFDEIDTDLYNEFYAKMTYSDIPDENKIKVFEIEKNESDITKIQNRVIECREYINKLLNKI